MMQNYDKFLFVKSCDEDMRLGKPLREEPVGGKVPGCCQSDTTSEPPGGNTGMGAPIKAPMSDGYGRNQGGTVEYFVSHP